MSTLDIQCQVKAGELVVALAKPMLLDDGAMRRVGLAWLDDKELARYRAFHFDHDRATYAAAHALTRAMLGAATGRCPASISFETDAYGRPYPCPRAVGHRLHFSLSHTKGLVACAVYHAPEVGVDVEHLHRTREEIPEASSVFSPWEAADVASQLPSGQAERFLAYWTLKEAYAKARSLGLRLPFSAFEFHGLDSGRPHVEFNGIADQPQRWKFWLSGIASTHHIALACASARRPRVRPLSWQLHPSGDHTFSPYEPGLFESID